MAIDPRDPSQNRLPPPRLNIDEFFRGKIQEVLRRRALDRTNYQEPDDTCDCTDFVTNPPGPPTLPRRRQPPRPAAPPRPPILPPPLPPPPARYQAPQLPNAVPPLIAPPPIIFPPLPIQDNERQEAEEETTSPPVVAEVSETTESPGDDIEGVVFENSSCCMSGALGGGGIPTDREFAGEAERTAHRGELGPGCYALCNLPIVLLNNGSVEFCNRLGIQLCNCYAKNNPTNPCYRGNGEISPPGRNITINSTLKKIPLPPEYVNPGDYYLDPERFPPSF